MRGRLRARRSVRRRGQRHGVAAALALVGASFGCGSSVPEPAPPGASAPRHELADFDLQPQSVGTPADGLVLRSVRHAAHERYYRLVFDLGLQQGRPAAVAPAATVAYRARDKSLELVISGVRDDLTGNRPLRTESGESFGKPVPIDRPPIAWIAREQVLDDAAVAYRIQLTREARYRLLALDGPARIVLDVEDTGGARPH